MGNEKVLSDEYGDPDRAFQRLNQLKREGKSTGAGAEEGAGPEASRRMARAVREAGRRAIGAGGGLPELARQGAAVARARGALAYLGRGDPGQSRGPRGVEPAPGPAAPPGAGRLGAGARTGSSGQSSVPGRADRVIAKSGLKPSNRCGKVLPG